MGEKVNIDGSKIMKLIIRLSSLKVTNW